MNVILCAVVPQMKEGWFKKVNDLMIVCLKKILLFLLIASNLHGYAQSSLDETFLHPLKESRPWVFWYWMEAAASKEGITADLQAMKDVGIAGAYLMFIKDTTSPPIYQPIARQLSPHWWQLVAFALQEAKRLDIQLAMHVSDGFALAGGPWITPELSMQKVVWTKNYVQGGSNGVTQLAQPEANLGYYKDIAVYAYRVSTIARFSGKTVQWKVTASNGANVSFLASPNNGKESFKSDSSCWIQYEYSVPFNLRSVQIHVGGNNYQAQRLIVQYSNDGKNFRTITRLQPPRHGWQDTEEDVTSSIAATKAKYFRFVYDKTGAEPGSEDLDAAKWKPSLKVMGIYLSDEPVINQYESKNGSIWRVSKSTTLNEVSSKDEIPLSSIVDLTKYMNENGQIRWKAPQGNWVVVRIGHTTTGQTNATGGGGKGLECDKFNRKAIELQFNKWFGEVYKQCGDALTKNVLRIFHVDSWECGSQNWSPTFANEFKKRRGYSIGPYLLAMTGVPVTGGEKFLHDVRQTIAELVNDVFYETLKKEAHNKGCSFSAESVAPTMMSDGLLHYQNVDIPMGEFWLNSPTHDKPNDMLDAISAAHIYGKNIVQAEAFTSVRMNWGEHPGNIKTLGDRNFALGINRMVLHVFMHNPWINRKPGMTLDGVGLYYQRNQTWFKQSKSWIDYMSRLSAVLQLGKPVVDIAVFTGEEVPRRSILPDRLVNTLPGVFGKERVESERKRLANVGQPLRNLPDGVINSANSADPEDWIDALNGYAYDSFNPDALLKAVVKNGKVLFPSGMEYSVLVFPGKHPLHPNEKQMSLAVAKKILQLTSQGAKIIIGNTYHRGVGMKDRNDSVQKIMQQVFNTGKKSANVVTVPFMDSSFEKLGVKRDVELLDNTHSIAWCHRKTPDADIYFLSNQRNEQQRLRVNFRITGYQPELWDPITLEKLITETWTQKDGRTLVELTLDPNASCFVVFQKKTTATEGCFCYQKEVIRQQELSGPWTIQFDTSFGGPLQPITMNYLTSWTESSDPAVKYYSGTAVYSININCNSDEKLTEAWIQFDSVNNLATVRLNGIDCGTTWTKPYRVNVTKALKQGNNFLEIEVSNTWANRLIGDEKLPPEKRTIWTTAPFRLSGKSLLPSGLVGKVILKIIN